MILPFLRQNLALRRARLLRLVLPLLLLAATVGSGCFSTGTNPVSGNTRAYGYSWKEEVKLGKEADQQIQKQYGVYDNEEVTAYVEELGQKVLQESHMRRPSTPAKFRNTEFHFRVLDSPIINAFALPGGYVYVTRGLMAHLNNEAQLAVVLGHEIGHVAGRHASKQAAKRQIMQGVLIGGAVAGQAAFGGNTAENVLGIGGSAAQLLSLSYSRDDERESDQLGVEYAVKAGYDAAEGAAFFTSLKRQAKQSGQDLPTWKSSHPDPGNREDTVQELARKWEQKVAGEQTTRNQDVYYATIEGLVLGKNPRQGFVEKDVFYHPDLAFRFPTPDGWKVQNQTSQVAMIQPSEEAFLVFRISAEETPRAAAGKFTGQKGLSVVERRQTEVNGRRAQRVVAEAQTKQGKTLRILTYFIEYEDRIYQFQGLTAAGRYETYRSVFERTMTGFDELRDADKLNVEPTRLTIDPASRTAAFRTFVDEGDLPDGINGTDLAIINQVELDETVEEGRPLKLPR